MIDNRMLVIMAISLAIAHFEGFFQPNTIPSRNNNPGDLKFEGQSGAFGRDEHGFAKFRTEMDGWRALWQQIDLFIQRGDSIESMMNVYAPHYENKTRRYIDYISSQTNIPKNVPLKDFIASHPNY